jgi:hypothetical protein
MCSYSGLEPGEFSITYVAGWSEQTPIATIERAARVSRSCGQRRTGIHAAPPAAFDTLFRPWVRSLGMEPLSLAKGAAVLFQGIMFLDQQAGEAGASGPQGRARHDGLASRRGRRGELASTAADPEAVERLHADVEALWTALAPFAEGKRLMRQTGDAASRGRATHRARGHLWPADHVRGRVARSFRSGVEGWIDADVVMVIADAVKGGALVRATAGAGEVLREGTAAGVHVRRLGP